MEKYLDIAAVPRRSFFELLYTFSTNELEREKLAEFSSAAGQNELHSYCNRPRRTALEVITKKFRRKNLATLVKMWSIYLSLSHSYFLNDVASARNRFVFVFVSPFISSCSQNIISQKKNLSADL